MDLMTVVMSDRGIAAIVVSVLSQTREKKRKIGRLPKVSNVLRLLRRSCICMIELMIYVGHLPCILAFGGCGKFTGEV